MFCCTLPADSTLTINNLRLVTSSVQDWRSLGNYYCGLGVPQSVLDEISANSAIVTKEDKKTAMLQYFLNNVPMASWQKVAGALYWRKEETALQAVKGFLTVTLGQSVVLALPSSPLFGFSMGFATKLSLVALATVTFDSLVLPLAQPFAF